jgi:hypothetical protein
MARQLTKQKIRQRPGNMQFAQTSNDNKVDAQEKFCGLIVDQDAARKSPQVIQ